MTFPSALVRQVEFDESVKALQNSRHQSIKRKFGVEPARRIIMNEDRTDFFVTFNANRNWYFGNGSIDRKQADFKLVAAKLVTKGLGFASNLVLAAQDDGFKYVIPKLYIDYDLPNTKYMAYMSPLDSLSSSGVATPWVLIKLLILDLFRRDHALLLPQLPREPYCTTFRKFEPIGLYSKNFTECTNIVGLYSKNFTDYNISQYQEMWYWFAGFRLSSPWASPRVTLGDGTERMLQTVYTGEFRSVGLGFDDELDEDSDDEDIEVEDGDENNLNDIVDDENLNPDMNQLDNGDNLDDDDDDDDPEFVWDDGDDYLMTPRASLLKGVTLKDKIESRGALYGPNTLYILEYTGYATLRKPWYIEFEH